MERPGKQLAVESVTTLQVDVFVLFPPAQETSLFVLSLLQAPVADRGGGQFQRVPCSCRGRGALLGAEYISL